MGNKNGFRQKLFKWVKYILIFFFGSSIFFTILYRFVNPVITPLMIFRVGEQLFSGEKVILKKDWVSLDEISPKMQLAAVAGEDNRFTEHFGFDFDAIQKARKYNERHKSKVRGASTISQQTAKNVFLWPQRSWIRKGLEVYFTVLIELFWSKERIMEVYLNVIEMGNGIYGIEAASRQYFNKPANQLTRAQSALIVAVFPNPRRWNPAHPSPYIYGRQGKILWLMRKLGSVKY